MTAALVCCLLAIAPCPAQEPPDTIPNGGMEGEYAEGLPPGWVANCYGENQATFRTDRDTPHSGRAALLVECAAFAYGGVQFRCGGQSVVEGQPYTLTVWLKGDLKGQVWAGIRKHGEPYTAYLMRYVRVGPQWRRYTIIGDSKGTDPDCGVYLMFAETGQLHVDDVSLRAGRYPAETAAIDAAPVKGNHVYNSSFELGSDGWAPVGGSLPVLVDPSSPDGALCAVCNLGGPGLMVESRPMTLRAGQKHTVSAWLRADVADTKVRFELVEYADGGGDSPVDRDAVRGEVTVGTQWARYSVSGVIDGAFTDGYIVRFHALTAAGEVRLDGVQVEEGDLSDYASAAAVELSVNALDRYPRPQAPVPLCLNIVSRTPLTAATLVRLVAYDLFGQEAASHVVRVPHDLDDHHGRLETRFPGLGLGIYRIQATLQAGAGWPGESVVGVLPFPGRIQPAPESFFGTHAPPDISRRESSNVGPIVALRSGARWHRIHDFACYVQWFFVEPEPGRWVWADNEVNYLRRIGFELLGTLARTPPWAGKEGKEHNRYGDWTSLPPRDLNEFSEYVRRTVEHYKGRIHVWEIWNEPYGSGFFSGTPEEYAEVLKAGYRACKEADPTCTVLGLCCFPGLPDWIDRVLAVAGTGYMDALSYHTYFGPGYVAEPSDGGPLPVTRDVERLRELMAKRGKVKPIWNTEGGVACPTFYSWLPPNGWPCTPREAAATYTKCVTLMMAAGVKRWCYYFVGWPAGGRGDYYLLLNTPYVQIDFDGSPKATLLAQSAAAQVLDGAHFVLEASTERTRAYVFERGQDAIAVAWARHDGHPVTLALPKGEVALLGMMANPLPQARGLQLGADPVYLIGRGQSAGQLATAFTMATH